MVTAPATCTLDIGAPVLDINLGKGMNRSAARLERGGQCVVIISVVASIAYCIDAAVQGAMQLQVPRQ